MLLLFPLTLYALLLTLVYGWVLEFIVIRSLRWNEDYDLHYSITFLLGLALLSGLLGIWSIFLPINLSAAVVFCGLAIAAFFSLRRFVYVRIAVIRGQIRLLNPLSRLVLALSVLFALYMAASAEASSDTSLYYAQAIRWIETYRVVPGLANLHIRFGFNTSIFLLAAFWGFAALGLHAYQVPGLVVFVAVFAYGLHLLQPSEERPGYRLSMAVAFSTLFFLWSRPDLLGEFLSSPGADLPSAMVSWVVFLLAMELVEKGEANIISARFVAIFVLSAFALAIKLSAAPILLICLGLLWSAHNQMKWQSITVLASLPTVVLLPWLFRTVVLTGYPLFPFARVDFLRLDWKVPSGAVNDVMNAITAWGRVQGSKTADKAMQLRLAQWVPIWYSRLSDYDRFLVQAILAGLLTLLIFVLVRKQFRNGVRVYGWIYGVSIIGSLFWFVQAPDPRFGYGFLVVLLAFVLYAPIAYALSASGGFSNRWLVLTAQLALLYSLIVLPLNFRLDSEQIWLLAPRPYPVAGMSTTLLGSQTIYTPRKAWAQQCWYAAFPCAPKVPANLALRGTSLQDGFYIEGK